MFEDCFLVLQRFHSNGQWFSAAVLAEKRGPSYGLQEVESKVTFVSSKQALHPK